MTSALRLWLRQASTHTALTLFLVLSLAVGLGGGVFAMTLNSVVLWRSLPFDNAEDLVTVRATNAEHQPRWLSWQELEAIAAQPVGPFSSLAGYTAADFNALSEPGLPPEPLGATLVSSTFFDTFRITPAIGQVPARDTYGASRDRVVLLSHDFWQRRYKSAPDILGRAIRLSRPEYLGGGDESYRVIGVLPPETWLFWKEFDIVLPMQADASRISDPSAGVFERAVARMTPEATLAQAHASTSILADHIRAAGSTRSLAGVSIAPLQDAIFADLKPSFTVILWLAIMVFSLAALNIVISTIAQAATQRRSTAIRIAVGANYGRLFGDAIRQHAITLGIAAGLGLALAQWLVLSVGSQMPDGWISRIPGQLSALKVDGQVLAWLCAALATMLVLSSSAVHGVTRRVQPWLLLGWSASEDAHRSKRWRSILVGVEIALCAAVVTTTLTLVSQLLTLQDVPLGVDRTRTSAVWINLGESDFAKPEARIAYYDRLLREAGSIPAIEAIGGVSHPFNLGWQSVQVSDASAREQQAVIALDRSATPGYLLASGLRLLEGRWFTDSDRISAPDVAVVSKSLASARWPNASSIGQQLEATDDNGVAKHATVVGVVSDTRHAPHQPPDRMLYRAVAQSPPPWLYVIVRARPGDSTAIAALNDAIWRVNPDQPVDGPWSVEEWVDGRTRHLRFLTLISVVLGAVGLVLAAAGIYGLMSWTVTTSRRSIAVRRAIGASNRDIHGWFAGQWTRIVLPGLAGGWLLHSLWTSVLIAEIQGLQTPGSVVVGAGIGLVAVAAAVATAVPLRDALKEDSASLMR